MNELESKVLAAVKANPMASQNELASSLEMSRESVAGYIMRLTRKGAILGKGYILPKRANIVVLGGANVDLNGTSDSTYRSADSNPGRVNQSAGGVGRNIAENLARLGNETSLISMVGHDSRGQFLLEHARAAGIDVQDCIQHPSQATSSYLALNNQHGELVGAIADMAIFEHLTSDALNDKLSKLQGASFVVVEANLSADTLAWLAHKQLSAPIAADAVSVTKAVRLLPLLSQIDLLKVNKQEALAILDLPIHSEVSEQSIIDELIKLGVRRVLLSLGKKGALLGNETETTYQVGPSCNMQSDTGAGDALLAGFIHADRRLETTGEKLRFALACAVFTLESKHPANDKLTEATLIDHFRTFLQPTSNTAELAD